MSYVNQIDYELCRPITIIMIVNICTDLRADDDWIEETRSIDISEWMDIKPIEKGGRLILTDRWRDYLLKMWANICDCVIAFGYCRTSSLTSRKKNSPFIRQDAYCTFENCCKFRIIILKTQDFASAINMQINTLGKAMHGRQPRKFRRTTKQEAANLGKMLKEQRPEEVYEQLIDEADYDKLLAGNYNQVKSPAVLRRLKSVVTASERFHKDVSVELDALQNLYKDCDIDNKIKGFIQRRGSNPFYAIMYTQEQLKLLNENGIILYFDATGSIFKKWQGFEKRMLLYSLILRNRHKGEPPVPIAEMICNDHTTEMISHMLFTLRMDLSRLHGRSGLSVFPVELIVTDFSWALIHSALQFLNNGMNVDSYLESTYNSLVNEAPWTKCTGVFLCANHVVHIVARKLNSLKNINKGQKEAFLHSFVLLQYTENFSLATDTIRLIFRVFGNKYVTPDVRKATKTLLMKIKRWKVNEKSDSAMESSGQWALHLEPDDDVYPHRVRTTIRNRSPWMGYFKSISDFELHNSDDTEIELKLRRKQDENPYYNAEYLKYLLTHWLPMFSMWSMAVSQLYSFKKEDSWYSNAHVENWFASVKARHLRKSSIGARVKVSKFVQGQREGIRKRLKRFELSEKRDCQNKAKNISIPGMHDVEESWGKRTRARFVKPTANTTDKLFSKVSQDSSHSDTFDVESKYSSGRSSEQSCHTLPSSLSDDHSFPTKRQKPTKKSVTPKTSACKSNESGFRLMFMLRSGVAVSHDDLESLKGQNWLQIHAIQAYMSCLETPHCAMWSDADWHMIEKNNFPENAVMRTDWNAVRYIYFVLGEPSHFVAVLINLKDMVIAYINTLAGSRSMQRRYAVIWNLFAATYLSEVLKGNVNFSSTQIDYPKQRDGTSCGVLVSMFGRNIATSKTLMSIRTDITSISQYRQEILQTFQNNKDTENCCDCRKPEDPATNGNSDNPWVLCSRCTNKFHFRCMMMQCHASEEEMKTINLICSHCRN